MPTTTPHPKIVQGIEGIGTQVQFEALNEPGAYVCNWSGHLLRVPPESLGLGHSPLLTIGGHEPLYLTKIYNDPYVPINKARELAADCDVAVNF